MKRISVFCGSSPGREDIYATQARQLGGILAQHSIGVVYGGAKVGLMGAVADGALEEGGSVIGVLPHFLQSKEVAHEGLTELILVETMHERKMKMNDLCDGIITLPGGFGTLEELFEILTWRQLGLHQKPIGILNIDGYYDALLKFLDQMVEEGFLKEVTRNILLVSDDIEDLLNQMKGYQAPEVGRWISKETT